NTYFWRVKVVNNDYESNYSATKEFNLYYVSTVSDLLFPNDNHSDFVEQLRFGWDAIPEAIEYYELEITRITAPSYTITITTANSVVEPSDYLDHFTTGDYTWRVRGFNAGCGDWSVSRNFSIQLIAFDGF